SRAQPPHRALQPVAAEHLADQDPPALPYAAPHPVPQQKLEKLPQSAQPKTLAAPEPEVTAPVAEIQEWEIPAPALETVAAPEAVAVPSEPAPVVTAPDLEPEVEEPEPGKFEESHYTLE